MSMARARVQEWRSYVTLKLTFCKFVHSLGSNTPAKTPVRICISISGNSCRGAVGQLDVPIATATWKRRASSAVNNHTMVKQRLTTADVAGEVSCLKRLLGMRLANIYDINPKVRGTKTIQYTNLNLHAPHPDIHAQACSLWGRW